MATHNPFKVAVSILSALILAFSAAPSLAAGELQRVEHPALDMLFTSIDAQLVGNETVYLESVSVWYPTESVEARDGAQTLRASAADELVSAFAAAGLAVTAVPEESELVIRVQLIDFTRTQAAHEVLAWQRRFKFDVEPGRLTLVAEIVDNRTKDTIMRMADLQDAEVDGLRTDLNSVLRHWSNIVATSVSRPSGEIQLASR